MTKHRSIRWKLPLVAVVIVLAVLAVAGTALAASYWSDMAGVAAKYGITDDQIAQISDGYKDGTWKPFNNVTRAQFTKMAVLGLGVTLANPATPSYSDVPAGSAFYPYIEGAKAAGLVNGIGGGLFGPNNPITRQQAAAILARYVAQQRGYDLASMTDAQASAILGAYPDGGAVAAELKKAAAFAVQNGILKGNPYGYLVPAGNVTRIAAAAMIIRAADVETAPARLAGLVLEQAAAEAGPYSTSALELLRTSADRWVYWKAHFVDQYGNTYSAAAALQELGVSAPKLRVTEAVTGPVTVGDTFTGPSDLLAKEDLGAGQYTAVAWIDTDTDGEIDETEMVSNSVVAKITSATAAAATLTLKQDLDGPSGPHTDWVTAAVNLKTTTAVAEQKYQVMMYDQAGTLIGPASGKKVYLLLVNADTGYQYGTLLDVTGSVNNTSGGSANIPVGNWTVKAWYDANGDTIVDSTEVVSNAVTTNVVQRTLASITATHAASAVDNVGPAAAAYTTDSITVVRDTDDGTQDRKYWLQITCADQFGGSLTGITAAVKIVGPGGLKTATVTVGTPLEVDVNKWPVGQYTVTVWVDTDSDGEVDATEVKANALTFNLVTVLP